MAAIPLFFVIYQSLQLPLPQWKNLWASRLPDLMWNTFSLAVAVAIGSLTLGISSAWLIARRRFAGRTAAMWLMILPLAIPTYVFAYIYTSLFSDTGWLGQLWFSVFGADSTLPNLYSVHGAALILSLSGFPYIFLLVHTALSRSNPHLEEAAHIQGANSRQVLLRITLPILRPAIAAGLALVTLHTLSDFGAVSMLRYQTFTLSIYLQMSGRFDYQSAAALSIILVSLALMLLILERFFRKRQRYYSGGHALKYPAKQATRLECLFIWSWLGIIALLAFGLPLSWMLSWTSTAITEGIIGAEFWGYVRNSLLIALFAATLAVLIALPIGLYHARKHSMLSSSYIQLSSVGFVLPGPVIALGILTFLLSQLPMLYGGLTALMLALLVRFLPLAIQSQESSLQQLKPSLEQASHVHGAGPLETLRRVTLPLIRSGLVGAWVLVFIDALKELPATLLLRPIGFDTLPVRIWIEASEEMLELAAPAALMLLIGTLPALWIMMRSNRNH